MSIHHHSRSATACVAALALATCCLPARAAPAPRTLQQAVQAGARSFATDAFGGHGSCIACHSHGGVGPGALPSGSPLPSLQGAAAQFPRWRGGRLVTLDMQIAHCIRGALGGTPPSPDSARMTELVAYLTALSRGRPMGLQLPSIAPPSGHAAAP